MAKDRQQRSEGARDGTRSRTSNRYGNSGGAQGKRTLTERLPPRTPPEIPAGLTPLELSTGDLGAHVAAQWKDLEGGGQPVVSDAEQRIEQLTSDRFWLNQIRYSPFAYVTPDPRRPGIQIAPSLGSVDPVSDAGAAPAYRASLVWGLSFANRIKESYPSGELVFSLGPDDDATCEPPAPSAPEPSPPSITGRAEAQPGTERRPAYDGFDATLDFGLDLALSVPAAKDAVRAALRRSGAEQILRDASESILQSGTYAPGVLEEEFEALKEHWPTIVAVSAGLVAAEITVGILASSPDPTMASKIVAAVLQAIILGFAMQGIIAEGKAMVEHALAWWTVIKDANGDPKAIADASKSFCRLLLHVFLAILAATGLRHAIRGLDRVRGMSVRGAGEPPPKAPVLGEEPPPRGSEPPVGAEPPLDPRKLKRAESDANAPADLKKTLAEFDGDPSLQRAVFAKAMKTVDNMQNAADDIAAEVGLPSGRAKAIAKRGSLPEFVKGVREKMQRKGYEKLDDMNDMSRGRFETDTPEQVEQVFAAMQKRFSGSIVESTPPRGAYPRRHVIVRDAETGMTHEWQIGTIETSKFIEVRRVPVSPLVARRLPKGMITDGKTDFHTAMYDAIDKVVGDNVPAGVADRAAQARARLGLDELKARHDRLLAESGKGAGGVGKEYDAQLQRLARDVGDALDGLERDYPDVLDKVITKH